MSDNDGKKPLGLRGSSSGNVKQSFSHGRTKNVVVETKRKRVVVPKPGASKGGGSGPVGGDPSRRPAGISDAELERRMKALALAKARETEEAAKREAEEKAREAERERRRAEAEAKEREEREREEALLAEPAVHLIVSVITATTKTKRVATAVAQMMAVVRVSCR